MGKFVFIPPAVAAASLFYFLSCCGAILLVVGQEVAMAEWLDGVLFNLCSTQNDARHNGFVVVQIEGGELDL